MKLTKEKMKLTSKKSDAGLVFEVDKRDTVKLVRESWRESFKKVETNRKAVLTRGWGPKTVCYNNILHKEIIATKQSCKVPSTSQLMTNITPSDLNENEGLAGTLIECICLKYTEVARKNGQTAEERKKKCQESAKKNEKNMRREFPLAC